MERKIKITIGSDIGNMGLCSTPCPLEKRLGNEIVMVGSRWCARECPNSKKTTSNINQGFILCEDADHSS